MTHRSRASRIKAFAFALAFILQALVVVTTPAEAQSAEPPAPSSGVLGSWQPLAGTHTLYLGGDNSDRVPASPTLADDRYVLGPTKPAADNGDADDGRFFGGQGTVARAVFSSPALEHDVTFTKTDGDEPVDVELYFDSASVSSDLSTMRFSVYLNATNAVGENITIAEATSLNVTSYTAGNVAYGKAVQQLYLRAPIVVARQDYALNLEIVAVQRSDGGVVSPVPPRFTVFYENAVTPSALNIESPNVLYVAPWLTDKALQTQPQNTFAKKTELVENVLNAFVSVKSAFGIIPSEGGETMTASGLEVRASILNANNLPVVLNESDPAKPTSLLLKESDPRSDSQGFATRRLENFNYASLPAGLYTLRAAVKLTRGGDAFSDTVSLGFSVSQVGYQLSLWPGETDGHAIYNGTAGPRSTTYILNVTNLGATQDTVTLSTAWQGTAWILSGELAQATTQVTLAAKESKPIYVTVLAPSTAQVGDSASLLIKARSLLDSTERSQALVTTLTDNAPQRAVGLIVNGPSQTLTSIAPYTYEVLVWNKGTDRDTFNVNITSTAPGRWSWTPRDVRVENLAPGAVQTVSVTVTPPSRADTTDSILPLLVRATSTSPLGGIRADQVLTTTLKGFHSFNLEVFNPTTKLVGTTASYRVIRGCQGNTSTLPVGNPGSGLPNAGGVNQNNEWNNSCVDDTGFDLRSPDWIAFRLWITNTGTLQSTYRLAIPAAAFRETPNPSATYPPTFFRASESPFASDLDSEKTDFGWYDPEANNEWRGLAGNQLTLAPGEKAELYVKVRQTNSTSSAFDRTLSFNVTATETSVNVVRAVDLSIQGVYQPKGGDGDSPSHRTHGIHVESLQRLGNRSQGNFSILNDTKEKNVLPGGVVEFPVRVSNLANFISANYSYDVGNDRVVRFSNRSINVSLITSIPSGWEVRFRNATQTTSDPAQFDWRTAMDLVPPANYASPDVHPRSLTAMWDHDLVVQVKAPATAKVNVDSLAPMLMFRAVEVPAVPYFYELKALVGSPAGVNMTVNSTVDVRTGTPTSYPITLQNTGGKPLRLLVSAEASGAARGWTVAMTPSLVSLGPGEIRTTTAKVNIPRDQTGEGNIVFRVCEDTGALTCPATGSLASTTVRHRIIESTALLMDATILEKTISLQGGVSEPQNFSFTVKNGGAERLSVSFDIFPGLDDPFIKGNWSQLTVSPASLPSLEPNQQATVNFVVKATGATSGSAYAFTVKAFAKNSQGQSITRDGRPANLLTFTATTLSGSAAPILDTREPVKSVDRAGFVRFPIDVRNVGSLQGTFPLSVPDGELPAGWRASIEDASGRQAVSQVTVGAGQSQTVYLNVSAPRDAPPAAVATATILAYGSANSASFFPLQVTAAIHDYAFKLELPTSPIWIEPGASPQFTFGVRNLGNGWDNLTFLVALDGEDNRTWERRVELNDRPLTLKPDELQNVTVTLTPPTGETSAKPWVTPGAKTLTVYAWSVDAQAIQRVINVSERGTIPLQVYNFKHDDVDEDGVEEIAIDLDRDSTNGFETFREWKTTAGTMSRVVESFVPEGDGKTAFILDTGLGNNEGQGDTYWNVESGIVTAVQYVLDAGDGRPVFLFDRSGIEDDKEEVDTAFFAGVPEDEQIRRALQRNIARTDGREFLLFAADNEDVPVLYFNAGDSDEPTDDVITEVEAAPEPGREYLFALRTDPNRPNEVTHYFDVEADKVQDATNKNVTDFLVEYWYFIALFALVLVVSAVVVVKRLRNREE